VCPIEKAALWVVHSVPHRDFFIFVCPDLNRSRIRKAGNW